VPPGISVIIRVGCALFIEASFPHLTAAINQGKFRGIV
jgi:hypothetical protein